MYVKKMTYYYSNVIYTWTILDTNKFNDAKKNNLNYLVFYTLKDALNWLNNLQ